MNAVAEDVPSPASLFEIGVIADGTVGYAALQNDVPLIRELSITNTSAETFTDVEVIVSAEPAFAEITRLRFDRLAAGETRRLAPLDIKVSHVYLAGLTELERGRLVIEVRVAGNGVQRADHPIEVLAYDQWAGSRALPELLAAFCMPNDPAVDSLVSKAAVILQSQGSVAMTGYQTKNRDHVWLQVAALYAAIANEQLQYANPPASFGDGGQKIRTPDRMLAGRLGTCLDLAMLLASCLEQAGLHPVVLFQREHAWVGCWLVAQSFPTPSIDDVQAVRKRVQSGELIVIEATLLCGNDAPALTAAASAGFQHLSEESLFRFAIDISRARERRILPLPSRGTAATTPDRVRRTTATMTLEAVPPLPPLDPSVSQADLEPTPDTPEARLARWKSRLLDLTLRNRLLNFKPAKTNIQLMVPDAAALEDSLSRGVEFRFQALPQLMEGADPRVSAVHVARNGQQPLEETARDHLRRKELLAMVSAEKLDARLLEIFTGARLSLEEGGSNTLFLAIGLLRWTEEAGAATSHLAPLLLIPVTMDRKSVRSGFTLTRHDDEALVNPTLLQLLQNEYALTLRGLDPLPKDDHGVDVEKIWQVFRLAVGEIQGWEVVPQVHLGTFAFTKYLMWKDLQDRTAALRQNRVVAHLMDHPGETFASSGIRSLDTNLDDAYQPQDLFTPMLADSSQLQAVCTAADGHDMVLEGPPGTGKSQTITNLITHFLARGKTVLFVSEKMAALDVVHRRLQSMGLGPFCLELHSAKAKKTDVVKQLGTALGFAAKQTQADWERGASRLADLRQELNQFVRILHHRHPNDLTVYGATGLSVLKRDWIPAEMPWSDPDVHDRAALNGLRELVRQLHTASSDLRLRGHPLEPIAWADWAPGREGELYSTAASLDEASVVLDETMRSLAKVLPMATAASLQDYGRLDALIEVLLAAPGIPAGLAAGAVDPAVPQELRILRQHNEARASLWTAFDGSYRSDIASLDGNAMAAAWQRATSLWWPQRWLATRQIAQQFQKFRTDAKIPAAGEVEALLPKLQGLNREDAALASLAPAAAALLDGSYQGTQTDWGAIERFAAWTRSYADATLRFAKGDPAQLDLIRTKTLPLVGAHRALIAPATPIGTSLQRFRESYRDFMAKLDSVERLANCPGALAGDPHTPGVNARLRAVLQRWHGARRQLRAWCAWQAIRSRASAEGLEKLIAALEADGIVANQLSDYFEFSYQSWWLKGIIDREPILRSFMSADHERKIREFRSADEEFQRLTREYVIATLAGRIPHAAVQTSPDSEMGRLRRQMQMQRGLQPVRTLIQNLPTLLPKLKPVMLMSPLSVAQYLDAGHPAFDLVVFDEASQISVWDAVGAIARGKQLVVVGDPKQLPPTTFFASTDSTNDAPQAEQDVKDLESILDECLGAGLHQLSLDWHYRSRHESLITFSNVRYYDSRLITFPSPVTRDTAVSFRAVTGSYDRGASRTNRAEADAIVEEIAAHYRDPVRRRKSLGVVTFNQPQRTLIEALLDERRRQDDELDRTLSEVSDEALFIKNLENVQGDERDVILFSITYGPDRAGHVTMNFGPLNLEGGHRRLNVAITRARDQVIIFSTLQPDQIDAARASAPGVIDLKNYLDFAKRGPKALIEQSLPTGLEPESPFEVAVLSALRDKGWIVHPQVGCTGFRIDMAVVDPRAPGRYLLGVECDGRMYHSGANARDRDRLRQLVLEGLGWRLHRIWSTDWWTDSDGQIEKLDALLKTILATPLASMPPQPPAAPVTPVDTPIVKAGSESPVAVASPAMPVYAPVAIEGGAADDFYLPGSTSLLTAQLLEVITREGPIAEDVLFRRLARAWSLGRTGARITARLTSLARVNAIVEPDGRNFYWPDIDRSAWREFRLSDGSEASKRHIDELALEESANIADYLLDQGGSTSLHDLARNVCQSVGMGRITADAETRARMGIESLVAQGRATDDAGRIRKN